jgi:hypothetical protein
MLIDGGSSINLLYRTTMEKLGIPAIQLKPTKLTFHRIVPGHSCTPMGKIQLEVLFSEKDNHRREPIWFEVVDLNRSIECAIASSKLAEALVIAEEKRQLLQRVAATQPGRAAPSPPSPRFKLASGAKEDPPKVGKEAEVLVSGAGPSSR